MGITTTNPYYEEKKRIINRYDLSNEEKDELLDELTVKSVKFIKEGILRIENKMKKSKDFIFDNTPKIKKVKKKELRNIYKETISRSREIKSLYDDMRELNKLVRDLLQEEKNNENTV